MEATIEHHTQLTSSEIAVLWGSYLNDTLAICVITHFLQVVGNEKIRPVLEYAFELSSNHVETTTNILKKEKHPIPQGFTEQDVVPNAPRLFSDAFMLYYILNMGSMGLNNYAVALPNSYRKDIRDYYTACLHSSAELYNRSTDTMTEMGLLIRSPYIPYIEQVEFVQKRQFLSGWLGKQRPLTTIEIAFLFNNLQRNAMGSALLTGFSQAANSKITRQYFVRGAEIAKHHCAVFSKFLSDSDIQTPMSWDVSPTRSTDPPFSEKLMMFHATALNTSGMGFYGASLGGAPRRDLAAAYSRLIVEVGEFTEDGANIMIDHGWLEKPPIAPDRQELASR